MWNGKSSNCHIPLFKESLKQKNTQKDLKTKTSSQLSCNQLFLLCYVFVLCYIFYHPTVVSFFEGRRSVSLLLINKVIVYKERRSRHEHPFRQPTLTAQEIYILMAESAQCHLTSEWKLSLNLSWLPPNDPQRQASSHISTGTKQNRCLCYGLKTASYDLSC